MRFLSIQSWVTYGHVGNAAAIFPLQRLGHDVLGIHTVQFSNHLGYGTARGRIFDAPMIDEIIEGLDERGVLGSVDAVLSGYLGSVDLGQAVLQAVGKIRHHNPQAVYCCDPVLGDVGRGIYVRAGLPEFFRDHAVKAADILTPNHFELELLSGQSARAVKEALAAAQVLRAQGAKVVLVTSLLTNETPDDCLDVLACGPDGAFVVRTPKFDCSFSGSGDITAALFSAHWLASQGDTAYALSLAASTVYCLLQKTVEAGRRELAVIGAQDQFVAPDRLFMAQRLEL